MLPDCLSTVADPRRGQGRRYPLAYILLFSVLAMLCEATSYRQIQRFMTAHRERLNEWLGLSWPRAPAHTSLRYILQALDPEELERAFRTHSRQLLETGLECNGLPAIALDGKVLRGSFDRFEDQKAVQILSAFCHEEQLILGHLPVATKTNEIPVAQQLIEELGLSGGLYTLDALHCQKNSGTGQGPGQSGDRPGQGQSASAVRRGAAGRDERHRALPGSPVRSCPQPDGVAYGHRV